MSEPKQNESLERRLRDAALYDEFCALMFGQRVKYEDLLEQLEKWNLSSSLGALTRFNESNRSEWTLERAKRETANFLAENAGLLDEAQKKVVAERLFNLAATPDISDKTLLKMRDQEIKMAQLRHDAQRIDQAETKLEQAEKLITMQERKIAALEAQAQAAQAALDQAEKAPGGVTPETITAIREAFGMKTDA
jgi:hypothetical protein